MKQFEIKIIFSIIIVIALMQLSSCKVQDTMMVPAGTYIEFSSAPPSAGAGGDPVKVTALHNFDK